jgi:dienelactone hydrolase
MSSLKKDAACSLLPHDEAGGWMHWPENSDYSSQFLRVLCSAQGGGGTISECFFVAARITPGDDESWHCEWKAMADLNRERGDRAFAAGNIHSACSNWLRASNYYRTSEAFMKLDDERRELILRKMRACSRLFILHQDSPGEEIRIPCFEGGFVDAYFLPAPGAGHRAPVVICVGEAGHFKDEHLYMLTRQSRERGLSLLLVDLPGQGAAPRTRTMVRYEVETAISCCVDYLTTRSDVDSQHIAIFGAGLGAALASRAAAADDRLAGAVCDGGLWDIHERMSTMQWMSAAGDSATMEENIRRALRTAGTTNIKCPVLVTVAGHDWFDARHAAELCRMLADAGVNVTLQAFCEDKTAAPYAQIDDPAIVNEFIFDWLSGCLDRDKATRA